MSDLNTQLDGAVKTGQLSDASAKNIRQLLAHSADPIYAKSVEQLAAQGAWEELNDRFYRTLAFGTGGLRGRTIGKIVTDAERGIPDAKGRPQFPCVGTNAMNYFNISRATQGLVAYLKEWFAKNNLPGRPKIAIAHDTRHFSRDFAELTAKVAVENGCDAALFEAPRSTPELSFAVRHTNATAGIVITASHNPPHDNGYKVYFADGGQVVEPHASGIIAKVNALESDVYTPLPKNLPEPDSKAERFQTENDLSDNCRSLLLKATTAMELRNYAYAVSLLQAILNEAPGFLDGKKLLHKAEVAMSQGPGSKVRLSPSTQGTLQVLGREIDDAYMDRLQTLVLQPELISKGCSLRIVYTPIHGTGGEIIKPMLQRLGFSFATVPEQDVMDGRFPTVKSPNPENAEALKMAIDLAEKTGADLVIATDPDCDRMGVAARNDTGQMQLFTGNQIGSLMAWYRAKTLFDQQVLTDGNASRGVIIKTFVTTDLQKAIAKKFGLHCVETLTGFKYIGEKLGKYENALPADERANYRSLTEGETRALRLGASRFYVFGGEESYGYSGADFVRDKDGNGATVMFAEVAAYAKSRKLTLAGLLDEIYSEFGFYLEKNGNLTFEGAEGAAKIKKLADSYAANPPEKILGSAVTAIKNFATEVFHDIEGDKIPPEKMLIMELANGGRVAVRPSGTEPKIKFYMFAHRDPEPGRRFTHEELDTIKKQVQTMLDNLWEFLQRDVEKRLAV
ncbi:MAG TPA: phospho-sugar mutase [Chthoniobacteraceae bacterium]|nr:phospho-sugar mutase [Chthoniobacteraceae bacterium]